VRRPFRCGAVAIVALTEIMMASLVRTCAGLCPKWKPSKAGSDADIQAQSFAER
jgi:hypothetical protein